MAGVRDPRPGELWSVAPRAGASGPRTVMAVIEVRGDRIDVVMTDSDPENATDRSLMFEPGECAPWPVRVQCDLPGIVSRHQLVERVGTLPMCRRDLRAAVQCDVFAAALDGRRGLPLHGTSDTRVAVLDAAAEAFWRTWMAD